MILLGIPQPVQRFFAPVLRRLPRPIRNALPVMVLALLLAPHRRCLLGLCGEGIGVETGRGGIKALVLVAELGES